jgi:DnaJ-class molecular chaperone
MVISTERSMTQKDAADSRPADVLLRQAPGQDPNDAEVEVPCAFCHGTGIDIFGIMSWRSTCCVCNGRGTTRVSRPYEKCAHCRGTGAIKRLTCTVCGGKGVVPLRPKNAVVCPECHGTGDDFSASAMSCLKCHGHGWVMPHTMSHTLSLV